MNKSPDFSRQGFLGPQAESDLRETRVAVVGLGGGGSHIAQQLAHVGVGYFRLIDPDRIEASNLNRLVGGTQDDVENETSKVEILRDRILAIRPWAKVEVERARWQEVDGLLKDSHVIFGCVDGYQQRSYLEGAARRFNLPYIDIGMDVTALQNGSFAVAGQVISSLPGGPCMRCLGFINSGRLAKEENAYGAAGINPQVVWANGVLASLAVGEFVKLRTPWFTQTESYIWLEFDGNSQTVTRSLQPQFADIPVKCPHHGGADGLGDPFFNLPLGL